MSEQLFRIGGVYRAVNGKRYTLSLGHEEGCLRYREEPCSWARDADGLGAGFRSLIDGRDVDPFGLPEEVGCRNLLPGELHCVNGEWVPFGELIHPASVMHTPSSKDRQSGVRTPLVVFDERVENEQTLEQFVSLAALIRQEAMSVVKAGYTVFADPNASMFLHDEKGHEAATAWREKQQAKAEFLAAEQAKRNAPLPCPAGFGYRPDQAPTGHQFGQFKTR